MRFVVKIFRSVEMVAILISEIFVLFFRFLTIYFDLVNIFFNPFVEDERLGRNALEIYIFLNNVIFTEKSKFSCKKKLFS